jgi:phospholipid/cholesterol/gamma-HCH transport system substrate-binding protein
MEREANYAAVGAFVLVVMVMAALFVYWYSDAREHRHYSRYEIYFDGSVAGLTRGAAVRYLGVDVGRVAAMNIDPRNPSRVQVLVDIDATAPISDRTVAELSLQGVTGVLYIDLLRNPAGQPLEEAVPSERYPVIRSTPSNFDVLLTSLPQMVALASGAIERLDRLLSDQNIASASRAVAALDQASVALPDTLRDVRGLIADLKNTSQELRATVASVRTITEDGGPRLRMTLERLTQVADNLAQATGRIDRIVAENRADVRAFTRDGLPELTGLLRDGRDAADELRGLVRGLRENPSSLLYQPAAAGVTIPR